MPVFLLIRHGENDYVKTGRLAGRLPAIHLNEKGRSQALAVAEKLAGVPVKAIYSSPLERALETAEPIAQTLGLEVQLRPGLLEGDIGEWQGKTIKGLARLKAWRMIQNSPSLTRFPGGESFSEVQFRMVHELEEIRKQHDPKDILICVSHADPIRLVVAYFLGMPLDMFQRFTIAPGSITALSLNEAGCHLLTINYDVSLPFPKS